MRVSRCFKCQGLGHIGKYCGKQVVCSRCGEEGHHVSQCKVDPARRKCINCKRQGYKDLDHLVGWLGCPALRLVQRRLVNRAGYE